MLKRGGGGGTKAVCVQSARTCVHTCSMCASVFVYVAVAVQSLDNMGPCWLLLGNLDFEDPYLEAEVVEEVIGWLGFVGTATANKLVARP